MGAVPGMILLQTHIAFRFSLISMTTTTMMMMMIVVIIIIIIILFMESHLDDTSKLNAVRFITHVSQVANWVS